MIRRSTWVLVGLFVVLLTVAYYLQRTNRLSEAQATPTAGIAYLFDGLVGDIQRLRLTSTAGDALEVEGGLEGSWTLVEPSGEQADAARIDSAVSQVQNLRVVSDLENPPALDQVGLDPPAYRLAVTSADGQEHVAFFGNVTPIESGYYARRDSGPLVVVSKAAVDSLLDLLETLPVVTKTPLPTGESAGTGTPEGTLPVDSPAGTPAETPEP
jgi:hypothetical protein